MAVGSGRATNGKGQRWVEPVARLGYATKGVVYVLIGGLALAAAFGSGGAVTGSKGAVRTLASQPLGTVVLVATGIGLAGYAVWRLIQALLDPENKGTDAEGIVKRLGYLGSAVMYAALAVAAGQLVAGSGGGGSSKTTWVAKALAVPAGAWLIGILGLFIVGVGVYQLYKAKTTKFRKELKTFDMSSKERKAAIVFGRIGLAARGVVFPIIGVYLVRAAVHDNAALTKGVGGALREIGQKPFGVFLLAVVAAGLVAYGLYQLFMARYRKIPGPG